jgi:hypothetical protein
MERRREEARKKRKLERRVDKSKVERREEWKG